MIPAISISIILSVIIEECVGLGSFSITHARGVPNINSISSVNTGSLSKNIPLAAGTTISPEEIVNTVLRNLQFGNNYNNVGDETVLQQFNPTIQKLLGKNVKAESYKPAQSCDSDCPDLNCDFASSKGCCWKNTKDDGSLLIEIYKAGGTPDISKFEGIMLTSEMPRSPYAITADRKSNTKMWFVSAAIKEQPSGASITLKEWLSPFVELKVCTRKPNSKTLENCISEGQGSRPGPMTYRWNKAISGPLELVIAISGFDKFQQGGMAIFDDIKYQTPLCGGSRGNNNNNNNNNNNRNNNRGGQTDSSAINRLLDGNMKTSSMRTAGRANKPVRRVEDLSCSSFGSRCRWRSEASSNSLAFQTATGNPNRNRLRAYSSTSVPPISPFAVLYPGKRLSSRDSTYLVSDQVKCQRGDGELSLRYWTSRNSQLRICTRSPGARSPIQCSGKLLTNPGPAFVTIKGSRIPFEIYMKPESINGNEDYVIVDDINYLARLC